MKFKMIHENYNVRDLDASLNFTIVYVKNENSTFELELTWLKDHPQAYDLGECEFHLAFEADDFEAAYNRHKEMGCICFENKEMGIYFISDPDGYWLEIVPAKDRSLTISASADES